MYVSVCQSMSEAWVVRCRKDGLMLLGVLRVVHLTSYDELLELPHIYGVAFGLIDLFDHIPQNLDFFFFCTNLVAQLVDLFARVRLLFGTAVWGRLQQDFLLQFCICAFFDSNCLFEPLYFLKLIGHHLIQSVHLVISTFLLLGKFVLKLLCQLLQLFFLLLLQPHYSLQFLFFAFNHLLVTLQSLLVYLFTLLYGVPLCAHLTYLGL